MNAPEAPANFLPTLRQAPPELIASINAAVRAAFNQHGAAAFLAPQEAAVIHEVGHAVVGTHEGFKIRQITITATSCPILGDVWGGYCREAGGIWTSGPDSDVDSDLRRARFFVAGLAAEAATGLDKPGSSLDELALSQIIGINIALKLATADHHALNEAAYAEYVKCLWHEQVWMVALRILDANHEPCQLLADQLQRRTRVQGGTLRKVLAQVKRIAS